MPSTVSATTPLTLPLPRDDCSLYFGTDPKYEEVYLQSYDTPRTARQSLARFFQFYNHQRPHQALGYQTPAALYFGTRSTATAGDDSGKGGESAFCVFPTPS